MQDPTTSAEDLATSTSPTGVQGTCGELHHSLTPSAYRPEATGIPLASEPRVLRFLRRTAFRALFPVSAWRGVLVAMVGLCL